jgi:hypothetical protein
MLRYEEADYEAAARAQQEGELLELRQQITDHYGHSHLDRTFA